MKPNEIDPKAVLARPYSRVLIPDGESGTFTAIILEFPGCVAQGSTPAEAYRRLEKAAESWILAANDLGQTVPEPREENTYSGRFPLRMPKGLHKTAAELAEREGTSLNQFIVAAVAEKVGATSLYVELRHRLERQLDWSLSRSVHFIVKAISDFTIKDTARTSSALSTDFHLSYVSTSEVN